MKLSQERLLEIATMTRRRMLKLSGMAALSMAMPSAALAAGPPQSGSRQVQGQLQRLRTDAQFRGKAVMTPDRVLPQLSLTLPERQHFRAQMQLLKRVGMGLAFEAMRQQKSLRPLLLNPINVNNLIIMGDSEASRSLKPAEKAQIDTISRTFNAICGTILDYDAQAGLGNDLRLADITADVQQGFNRDDVDFVCATDRSCQNSGCTDSGCGDQGCTNGGCSNMGCDDGDCDNGNCSNELCHNQGTRCGDFDCSNGKKECLGGTMSLSEEFYDNLAKVLESAIERGPEMGFLVKAGSSTIRGASFLNDRMLNQTLRRVQPPAAAGSRPSAPSGQRVKP